MYFIVRLTIFEDAHFNQTRSNAARERQCQLLMRMKYQIFASGAKVTWRALRKVSCVSLQLDKLGTYSDP